MANLWTSESTLEALVKSAGIASEMAFRLTVVYCWVNQLKNTVKRRKAAKPSCFLLKTCPPLKS